MKVIFSSFCFEATLGSFQRLFLVPNSDLFGGPYGVLRIELTSGTCKANTLPTVKCILKATFEKD